MGQRAHQRVGGGHHARDFGAACGGGPRVQGATRAPRAASGPRRAGWWVEGIGRAGGWVGSRSPLDCSHTLPGVAPWLGGQHVCHKAHRCCQGQGQAPGACSAAGCVHHQPLDGHAEPAGAAMRGGGALPFGFRLTSHPLPPPTPLAACPRPLSHAACAQAPALAQAPCSHRAACWIQSAAGLWLPASTKRCWTSTSTPWPQTWA